MRTLRCVHAQGLPVLDLVLRTRMVPIDPNVTFRATNQTITIFSMLSMNKRQLSQEAKYICAIAIPNAISGVSQGSVIGPILFVIYVNDLPDRLSADSRLYGDDVKLIATQNCHDILQNSLNISASWSKYW